jgi:hypothetical protein
MQEHERLPALHQHRTARGFNAGITLRSLQCHQPVLSTSIPSRCSYLRCRVNLDLGYRFHVQKLRPTCASDSTSTCSCALCSSRSYHAVLSHIVLNFGVERFTCASDSTSTCSCARCSSRSARSAACRLANTAAAAPTCRQHECVQFATLRSATLRNSVPDAARSDQMQSCIVCFRQLRKFVAPTDRHLTLRL